MILFVVVDRFSKYAHFVPLAHPYIASRVARVFSEQNVHLHGIPETITCDQDVVFTSTFRKERFHLNGAKLQFSSAYHPQMEGQTEVVNHTVKMYLRCFIANYPESGLLGSHGQNFVITRLFIRHYKPHLSSFKVVYGRDPQCLLSYVPGASHVEVVESALLDRDKVG